MDFSGTQSVSLEIALDSDIHRTPAASNNDEGKKASISLLHFNDPPPSASELIPVIPKHICVNGLRMHGLQELELFLNPPSRGSMLNWEYVAAEFGFSNSKIMHLRTLTNPSSAVLQEIAFRPLKDLFYVLAKLNRVDVLLSLQPSLETLLSSESAEISTNDSGAYVNADKSEILTSNFFSGVQRRLNASNINIAAGEQKFILVTHHELNTNVALQKNYKWFLKNLRKQAKQVVMSVFDIDDYLEASCQFEGLHTLFVGASSIVCVFTGDYLDMLSSSTGNEQNVAVKQYLHKLMNAEFVEHGDNQRFRAVVFQGTGRDVLPIGWAKSTLVYEFPSHHLQLFRKLFT